MNGIYDLYKNKVPASMRLYAETMLPWNKKGAIDESYFSQDFLDDIRTQVWDKYALGEKHDTLDFLTRSGQVDEFGQRSAGMDTLTGYPPTYNALGTYSYDIVPPMAPAFDPTMINITDKYDWEPHYGTIPAWDFTGFVGENREGVKGKDVDLNMIKEYLMNLPKRGKGGVSTLGSGLELLGNYLGPRKSEDEGIDINLKIPFDMQKFLAHKKEKEAIRLAKIQKSYNLEKGEKQLTDTWLSQYHLPTGIGPSPVTGGGWSPSGANLSPGGGYGQSPTGSDIQGTPFARGGILGAF